MGRGGGVLDGCAGGSIVDELGVVEGSRVMGTYLVVGTGVWVDGWP